MTTTGQALEGARQAARQAARRRAGLDANPYPAGGTPLQQSCHRAWMRTYLHWRPDDAPPVDYIDDLTALAHGPDSTGPGADADTAAMGLIIPGGDGR